VAKKHDGNETSFLVEGFFPQTTSCLRRFQNADFDKRQTKEMCINSSWILVVGTTSPGSFHLIYLGQSARRGKPGN
jgi:hypothetical protein